MRSSKSRSRSKSNRPRTMGNIVNRVFDSSGPEGKVRGTPQQIIEKYLILARDAQLSNDRVAAEAFLQHAEHYTRMLGEAQRELQREADARREYQESNGHHNQQGNNQQGNGGNRDGQRDYRDQGQQPRRHREDDGRSQEQPAFYTPSQRPATESSADVIELDGDGDSGLVVTPEMQAPVAPRPEPTAEQEVAPAAAPRPDVNPVEAVQAASEAEPAAEAVEARPRRTRTPKAMPPPEEGGEVKPRPRRRSPARKKSENSEAPAAE
ncbi:hypothetical protein CG51_04200 [Haematobacter missouriensis]|uniref:Eukaryotic translation initiation factor 3 subunit 10 n=1 Tax=Haematobacter missouriensis TaxID=366616 RepID=A0A212AX51_9RHOB|nr:DUF4167 domain-containing protein [Haematobacter missouriensis]KFI34070.1 hypothetical protein CG51_04200 [Haematobacter missouriensis]OWJ78310.1 Eukaryotic translation initiation factor 3 subunit 10 [Haematobacter missouriensis]OWJ86059.1 Eukaryotic translation initiation factor 3 subunit 10 [Haematobacter missouriensis]